MDIEKAFSFVFEDTNWLSKILIGGLLFSLGFLIVPIFIVIGYEIEIIQKVMAGDKKVLPEWTDIGDKLVKGLKYSVAVLLYEIPLFIIMIVFMIITALLGAAASSNGSETAGVLIGIVTLLMFFLMFVYGVALLVLLPAITVKFAKTKRYRSNLKLQRNNKFYKRKF